MAFSKAPPSKQLIPTSVPSTYQTYELEYVHIYIYRDLHTHICIYTQIHIYIYTYQSIYVYNTNDTIYLCTYGTYSGPCGAPDINVFGARFGRLPERLWPARSSG